ncbi:hypothetical protein FGW37_26375 [Streptomyces rectiverticillatus]|uniref:hypothetical protein n=1 Tax=Streptomyces rectiverticillatus TaxID=173860 RepID=UPI0015C32E21|nr:hypothetical protein [Streptomyces rectiverticillatus]QLE74642.1 hypothetical protein FGW37_26375 [Streptomyces rectiverticillatus]
MITPKRPAAVSQPAYVNVALATLFPAIALITLALTLAEDLGDVPFFCLIGAEIALIAGMGALFGLASAQAAAEAIETGTERLQRDEDTLNALDPLRPDAPLQPDVREGSGR